MAIATSPRRTLRRCLSRSSEVCEQCCKVSVPKVQSSTLMCPSRAAAPRPTSSRPASLYPSLGAISQDCLAIRVTFWSCRW